MWGLGERLATMRLWLWRERAVRGGFREIKRSLGWHRPGRLDIAAVQRGRDAESRASHSRKPRRAGLVFTADTTHDGSGLLLIGFRNEWLELRVIRYLRQWLRHEEGHRIPGSEADIPIEPLRTGIGIVDLQRHFAAASIAGLLLHFVE